MILKELIKHIEELLPPISAMNNDRIGLQLQSQKEKVSNILIVYEVTDDVVNEAIIGGYDCIITFHPLIWMPLLSINNEERVGRLVSKLISNNIALISVHTTFDSFHQGTSRILLDLLELRFTSFLVEDKNIENTGLGVIGKFDKPMLAEDFLQLVSDKLIANLRYTEGKSNTIQSVAILGGSGSDFIDAALNAGADAYITADCTYHQFHRLKGDMWLIDPGHYEMEQFIPPVLKNIIEYKLKNTDAELNFGFSKIRTNPVNYYPDKSEILKKQINFLNK